MSLLVHIAAFWAIVVVAIRFAVCFPKSLPARILFSQHGPQRERGEPEAEYLARCARFHLGWSLQAALLFAVGWLALRWNGALAESLFFLVLWTAVIPALGGGALLAALCCGGRALWVARSRRVRGLSRAALRDRG